jgi:acetyl esterase/lipase
MKKLTLILPLTLTLALATVSAALPDKEFPIYPDGQVPLALGTDANRDVPTLTPYWPANGRGTGAAVVICPGGGYGGLAGHEGRDYALWLNERGIAGLVLKYRLGSANYRHPAMMLDVQRAIRVARANAAEWRLDPARIGVMGSSAGGHLAATALTHFDAGDAAAADDIARVGCRPDFGILCYAVISMGPNTHGGSRANLLGQDPTPELIQLLSNELQVTKDTPPTFIWHNADDGAVKVENSLDFAAALSSNKVPFELHVYQKGGHGQGLGKADPDPAKLLPWTLELKNWLKLRGLSRQD